MKSPNTSILGILIGAVQASHIDWTLLLAGDHAQIGSLVSAIGMALFGILAKDKGAQ